ncbi:CLUMA_CG012865, isoform A [Clunio marinus]|uniref:CLUMA_CG012865, isoform A n=1 Tax=Clunio marinus TaxID=568069 RepID=A0A1J1IJ28_9DIPT|nr:CLUMA_CG012865, isoform A [Clunio marinus]
MTKVISYVLLTYFCIQASANNEKIKLLKSLNSSVNERKFQESNERESAMTMRASEKNANSIEIGNQSMANIDLINNSAEVFDDDTNFSISGVTERKTIKKEIQFHAFTQLFDHFMWNIGSFKTLLNGKCFNDVQIYLNELKMSTAWGLRISDASGRYRGQFFFLNDFWLGSKQFCYNINNEFKNSVNKKYPLLQFFVTNLQFQSRVLHIGQCLPESCSTTDVSMILENDPASKALKKLEVNDKKTNSEPSFKILSTRKVPGEYNEWSEPKIYIFCVILIAVLSLVICATVFENSIQNKSNNADISIATIFKPKRKFEDSDENGNIEMNHFQNNYEVDITAKSTNDLHSKESDKRETDIWSRILLCFAYGSNSKIILNTKVNTKDHLNCIHGLRFITLMWTIMVHTYLQYFAIGENRFNRTINEKGFLYQIIGNATFSVDTFYFISGLLVVLLFLEAEVKKALRDDDKNKDKEEDEKSFWNKSLSKALMMIIYRFMRLTPSYLVIIWFTELSMKTVYNETVFTPGLIDHVNCKKYWWRNIFYINNFYPLSEMCLMWSWYLANDFQFFIILSVLLIISTRYLRVSLLSIGLLLVSFLITTVYMSVHYNYIHKVSDPFESFDILYDKPWQRFSPYFMGMFTGYILHRYKKPPKIQNLFIINICMWILSIGILFLVIFGVTEGQLGVVETSIYVSFGHAAWGVGLIWITLSCCWGLAKPINSLLSYNGFFPLSRLTYCTYLIHPTIMMITSFQCDGPIHLRHGTILTAFLGNAVISFFAAYVLSVLVESPVIRVLKILFR